MIQTYKKLLAVALLCTNLVFALDLTTEEYPPYNYSQDGKPVGFQVSSTAPLFSLNNHIFHITYRDFRKYTFAGNSV